MANNFRKYIQKVTSGWLKIQLHLLQVWDRNNEIQQAAIYERDYFSMAEPTSWQNQKEMKKIKEKIKEKKKEIHLNGSSQCFMALNAPEKYFVLPRKNLAGQHCRSWNPQNINNSSEQVTPPCPTICTTVYPIFDLVSHIENYAYGPDPTPNRKYKSLKGEVQGVLQNAGVP